MAWAGTEDFDSYSNGQNLNTLNGGSGWSAGWVETLAGSFKTDNTTVYNGTLAASCTISTVQNAERQLASDATGSGIIYMAMRRSANNLGSSRWNFRNTADNSAMSIILNASGNIVLGDSTPVTVASYSANTWYVIRVTYDTSGSGTYTAAVSTDAFGSAGAFGTESSSKAFQNAGDIRFALLDTPTASVTTDYWDYLSPTSPFTAATAAGRPNNLMLLGVS